MNNNNNITDEDLAKYVTRGYSMKYLDLSYTQITDVGIESLVQIKGLTRISLECCMLITSVGFKLLGQMNNVTHLNLLGCFIEDDDLVFVKGMISLTHLNLSWCRKILTDECLIHLTGTLINTLYILWCREITDVGLGYISNITRLKSLKIYNSNSITDSGLMKLTKLEHFEQLTYCNMSSITRDGYKCVRKKLKNNAKLIRISSYCYVA